MCSRKGKELKEFPYAAITFWWGALHRSVRFEGEVARVSEEESDEYFSCRPTGSKVCGRSFMTPSYRIQKANVFYVNRPFGRLVYNVHLERRQFVGSIYYFVATVEHRLLFS